MHTDMHMFGQGPGLDAACWEQHPDCRAQVESLYMACVLAGHGMRVGGTWHACWRFMACVMAVHGMRVGGTWHARFHARLLVTMQFPLFVVTILCVGCCFIV